MKHVVSKVCLFLATILLASCSTTPKPDQSLDGHTQDDAYWAALARHEPAFELDTASLRVANADERHLLGQWGEIITWPHIPVSAAQLPDGRILTWSSYQRNCFFGEDCSGAQKFTYTAAWNPQTGSFIEIPLSGHDMFCAGQVLLEDGTVFVNGGNNPTRGHPETSTFDYRTNRWTRISNMNQQRWYPTTLAMPNGNVFTALGKGGGQYPERWTQNQGWQLQTGINFQAPVLDYTSHTLSMEHPFLYLAPNGNIFHAGPTPQMHWINPTGSGSIQAAGQLGASWYPKEGVVVMYDEGHILVAGGSSAPDNVASSNRAMVINFSGQTPRVTNINSMRHARSFANGVVLPTGEVMVIGGNTTGIKFRDQGTILTPELWNPNTRNWSTLADMSVPRNYHSVALLLPDGRVWSAGGGLCNCAADHQNAQIYSPPYLFNTDGSLAERPVITSAPQVIRRSEEFTVRASANISRFSLIKFSSLTHSINTDLRALNPSFNALGNGEYRVRAHNNLNVMTPGYWMLFAINERGVPSVASIIQVSSAAPPPPPPLNHSLSVTKAGEGSGTVSSSPAGVSCGSTCSATFTDNTSVTLTASAASGSTFAAWSGACSGSGTCTVTMSQARSVTATFNTSAAPPPPPPPATYSLTVSKTGTGSGTVSSSPAGISCGSSCSHSYTNGTSVTLSASAASGSTFAGWSGACSGSGGCTVTMSQARSVTATFNTSAAPPPPPPAPSTVFFGVSKEGAAANDGTVTSSPAGISCGTICSGQFEQGLRITLTATTRNAAVFSGWSGACSGTGSCTVTLNEETIVAATFSPAASSPPPAPGTLTLQPISSTAQASNNPITYTVQSTGGSNPRFRWQFGDGGPETAPSSSSTVTHTFSRAGRYLVTVTATDDSGQRQSQQFLQLIHEPLTSTAPQHSSNIALDSQSRLWVVNPDNNSVSVLDATSHSRLREISVGKGPRALSFDGQGRVWVSNKLDATLSLIDPNSLSISRTVQLPLGSQPYGLVRDPQGSAMYVVLEGTGKLLKLDAASGAELASLNLGANPRHLSITADGSTIYVSRFISSPVHGEATANPDLSKAHGEVLVVATAGLQLSNIITLQHSNIQDTAHGGRGIPNYLGPAVISPNGRSAWVPSKQDNIARGSLRDGRNLNHENTIRSISSYIDLVTGQETYGARIDHDDSGIANSASFDPLGIFLFVAMEGSREVAVIDTSTRQEIARLEVGRAPQGLVVSPDGTTLFTHNYMDRSVSVHDLRLLRSAFSPQIRAVTTISTVSQEALSSEILLGKQLFYDSKDPRIARDGYISCASCHNDGGTDGRVWDFTGFGEGLRTTISLVGRGGLEDGRRLHWSANFDEVQDFEGQIRALAGGTGLMSDAAFHGGSRSEPLGDPKAGVSPDLDALAAYVTSLSSYPTSPHRDASGALTADGFAGRQIFQQANCASCHSGHSFSDAASRQLHNIGTLTTSSGQRLGSDLPGINTPSLRGVWQSAPYLHNGSALSLHEAVKAHTGAATLSPRELDLLVSYLSQIDGLEPGPVSSAHRLSLNSLSQAASTQATAGDADVPALHVALQASNEMAVHSFTLSSEGSGHDALDLSGVKLYLDVSGTGKVDSSSILLSSGKFQRDNGMLILTPDSPLSLNANETINILVTADINSRLGALIAGSSLALLLTVLIGKGIRKKRNLLFIMVILLLAACSQAPQIPQNTLTFHLSLVEVQASAAGEGVQAVGLPLRGTEIQVVTDQ